LNDAMQLGCFVPLQTWGEAESIATIRAALAHGINTIDTAPVYGFRRSEEIVGKRT
jgi:aryl-alcohol dehydrogenase-like predicted oxidoreductase